MRQARDTIDNGSLEAFRKGFVANYKTRETDLAANN
jgi:hypothetical protein